MKIDLLFAVLIFLFLVCATGVSSVCIAQEDPHLQNDTGKVRYDGMYFIKYNNASFGINQSSSDSFLTTCFLVFLKNGRAFYNNHTSMWNDVPEFTCGLFKIMGTRAVGDYVIVGDSVYATIATSFFCAGMRRKYYTTHFTGKIKNRDTIEGWKIVRPFPKIRTKFNYFYSSDTLPKTLHFVKYDGVNELQKLQK